MIIARILSLLIGYAFGLFQTGYIYGRTQGIDIRSQGSGNSGATNSLRVLGIKAGLITFLGDFFKAILSIVLVYFLFRGNYSDNIKLLELYAGFGTVIGHNFPFFLGFKGGKGIACTAGVIVAINPIAAVVCFVFFVLIVALTRYVSLGSVVVVSIFLILTIVCNAMGLLGVFETDILEFDILTACFTAMAIFRHRANIVRLLQGTENKISLKKK